VTSKVDLQEFRSAYLAEADEQLGIASAKLLAIEEASKRGQSDPREVRDLFRALHTIKGLSSMVGVEQVVAIAHRMESVLRASDRAGGRLPLAAIEPLLQGLRAIERCVRALAADKEAPAAPAALLDALDALEHPAAAAPPSAVPILDLDPALAAKLAPFELDQLLKPAREQRAMRADFAPSPAKAAAGFTINSVRQRVASVAEIVKVLPRTVPASEEAPGGLSFVLLLLTASSDEVLAAAVGSSVGEIHALTIAPVADAAEPVSAGQDLPSESLAASDDEPDGRRRDVLRVDVVRIDDAMERLAAMIVTRSRLVRAARALAATGADTRDLEEVLRDNSRQLKDLRAAILRVRMVPVSEVLDRMPLLVRGLRRSADRQVRLVVDAGKAELDKAVAERILPAIIHLIRNAVDHAIESPAERVHLGKPEEGTLRITCSSRSNTQLELSVEDDGRGIDREAVAARAGRSLSSDAALLDALCQPGLTTRDEATTTSGRGMGMDIVKKIAVDQLGGDLMMTTIAGVGTKFTLRIPLTIAIVDAFTLETKTQRFVVPVSMIDEIVEVDPARLQSSPGSAAVGDVQIVLLTRGREVVPLVELDEVLAIGEAGSRSRLAVVVRRRGEATAFGLERVVGQVEAVVRPLADPLVVVAGISGATDLGDGRPTLVLDLLTLASGIASGRKKERAA
jgi:two-component system chemotaxis sensor kinase CheA